MNDNFKIAIGFIFGVFYVACYVVLRLSSSKYKEKSKAYLIVGVMVILFEILCLFIRELLDFQVLMVIMAIIINQILSILLGRSDNQYNLKE